MEVGAGAGLLKEGKGGGGAGTFPIEFFKSLSFLLLAITLPFAKLCCVMHLKKKYFFCHHNFLKKVHSKFSKNEPENIPFICKGLTIDFW